MQISLFTRCVYLPTYSDRHRSQRNEIRGIRLRKYGDRWICSPQHMAVINTVNTTPGKLDVLTTWNSNFLEHARLEPIGPTRRSQVSSNYGHFHLNTFSRFFVINDFFLRNLAGSGLDLRRRLQHPFFGLLKLLWSWKRNRWMANLWPRGWKCMAIPRTRHR